MTVNIAPALFPGCQQPHITWDFGNSALHQYTHTIPYYTMRRDRHHITYIFMPNTPMLAVKKLASL